MNFNFGGGKPLKSSISEAYKFYNGEVTLIYDVEKHLYFKVTDGNFVPQDGVTTIIHIIDKSDALIPWAAKKVVEKFLTNLPDNAMIHRADIIKLVMEAKTAPRDILEDAGDVGHEAHAWIEKYIKQKLGKEDYIFQPYPTEERAKNCCIAAISWMSKHNVRWICTEKKIYSRKYHYAGTMDGKAYVDSCNDPKCCKHPFKDRLSVIDWKSSNYLYMEYLLQTSAYTAAEMEETGDQIEDRWIIRLGKDDGEFEPWHVESDQFEEDFEAFLECLNLYRSVESIKDRIKGRKDEIKALKKEEKEADKAAAKALKMEQKRLVKEQKKIEKEHQIQLKKESKAKKVKATKNEPSSDNSESQQDTIGNIEEDDSN